MYSPLTKILMASFLLLFGFHLKSNAQPMATIRGNNVNIRDGAGTNHTQLFQLNTGDSCQILFNMVEENILGYGINSWYKISHQGKEGFVFGAFLNFTPDKLNTNSKNAKQQKLSKITGNEVNARACASLACAKTFQLNKGDKVKVIGKTDDYYISGIGSKPWYEVAFNGQKGFVYSQFVDCSKCDFQTNTIVGNPANSNNNNNTLQGTIIGDKVNIRSCDNTSCPVLFQLDIGATCNIQREIPTKGTQRPWYKIKANGQIGYVYGEFLSIKSNVQRPIKTWAVIAGISDYAHLLNSNYGVTDLNYSDADAKRIYQFLKSPEGGNVPDNQIKLLRNQEATSQNILTSTQQLFSQASPQDLVIVYFSGHGGPNYFVAHDKVLRYSDMKAVIEQSPAKKRLCIADACYSWTWSSHTKASAIQKNMSDDQLEELYYDALANSGNGIALFMSSSNTETSIEVPQLGQGLFTYFYIQGLKGKADRDGNKIVTLKELYEYVQLGVSQTAWAYFQHQQTPKISGYFDTEMPIGIVR